MFMESFGEKKRMMQLRKFHMLTPYTRTPSSASLFSVRNSGSQKGPVDSPNEAINLRNTANYKINRSFANRENYYPNDDHYRCNNKELMNIKENRRSEKIEHLTCDQFYENFENLYLQNSQVPQPVLQGAMIGNMLPSDGDFFKGAPIFKEVAQKESGKKIVQDISDSNIKQVPDEFSMRRKENLTRVLTGPVEKVMKWFKLKYHFHILFEVIAYLDNTKQGKLPTEKHLVLRDEKTGPSLLVVYYELDVPLPTLMVGDLVKCIGRMTSSSCLQAFKVEQSSEKERTNAQRLFVISNLVAEEAKAVFLNK